MPNVVCIHPVVYGSWDERSAEVPYLASTSGGTSEVYQDINMLFLEMSTLVPYCIVDTGQPPECWLSGSRCIGMHDMRFQAPGSSITNFPLQFQIHICSRRKHRAADRARATGAQGNTMLIAHNKQDRDGQARARTTRPGNAGPCRGWKTVLNMISLSSCSTLATSDKTRQQIRDPTARHRRYHSQMQ